MSREPRPPSGGMRARVGGLAKLGGALSKSYASSLVAQIGRSPDERADVRRESRRQGAEDAFAVLGAMRGAVVKIGQLLSMTHELLPEEYAEVLIKAQAQVPPMHASLIRRRLSLELGGEPAAYFASFDDEPLAAASLGQVHRARLRSGEPVVVKVQYPGVAESVDSDLKLLAGAIRLARPFAPQLRFDEAIAEIRERLSEELDYRREAAHMAAFAARHAADPDVVVPCPYPEHSSERVLTMSPIPGLPLSAFLGGDTPDPDVRARVARTLFRALWEPLIAHASFHADPNPANYLIQPDGAVGLVDFGCVRASTEAERGRYRQLLTALVHQDEDGYRDFLADYRPFWGAEVDHDAALAAFLELSRWWSRPVCTPGPFRFTAGYLSELLRVQAAIGRVAGVRMPRPMLYVGRQCLGISHALTQLDVAVDYHALVQPLIHA